MHEPYTRTQKPNVSDRNNSEKTGITGNPSRRRKRFCRRQPAFAPSTGAKGGGIDNSGEQEKSYIFYTKEESYLRIQATWYKEERERVYGR